MIGTPTSSETLRFLLKLRPIAGVERQKQASGLAGHGGPKFQRMSGLG